MGRCSLTPLLFEVEFFELFESEPDAVLDFVFVPVLPLLLLDELPFVVFVLVLVAFFSFPAPFYMSVTRD